MSLLFIDGFDDRDQGGNLSTDLKGWTGSADWDSGQGRFGTSAMDMVNNETADRAFINTDPTIVIGFAMFTAGLPNAIDTIVTLRGDGNSQGHIILTTLGDNTISVKRGSDTAGSGTLLLGPFENAFADNEWAYWELKVTISDTVGAVQLRKNGISLGSASGLDTKNGGTNAYIDGIQIRGFSGSVINVDDVYILNTQGDINNDFLGDVHVVTSFPIADAGPNEWTPSSAVDHYTLLDEAPSPNTTDYIETDVVSEVDMFSVTDLTDTEHEIYGVQVGVYAARDDAGTRTMRSRIDSDGNIANGGTFAPGGSLSYALRLDLFETDPDGGGLWTPAQFNAAEFGVEVVE